MKKICVQCKSVIDAQILLRDGKVFMRKRCPEHGWFEALVFGDAARLSSLMAAGLAPMALATGLLTPSPGNMRAPEWVVFLAGCTFFLSGWLILLPERWIKTRGFLGVVLLTGFAAVFDWVSFGPGERHFSGGLSIGPLSIGILVGLAWGANSVWHAPPGIRPNRGTPAPAPASAAASHSASWRRS